MNCSCHSWSLNQRKRISIAFVCFGCILPLTTTSTIELSVCSGVGGCLCPISFKMILIYTASLDMMYKDANYASVADDITCFIMWTVFRTAPLFCCMVESLDKKNCFLPCCILSLSSGIWRHCVPPVSCHSH